MSDFPWLTTLGVIPLVGSVVVAALPAGRALLAKQVALVVSLAVLVLSVVMATGFDPDGERFQFTESYSWIPQFGVRYGLGVDGIALVLIVLAAVLMPIVILASWNDADSLTAKRSVGTFGMLRYCLELFPDASTYFTPLVITLSVIGIVYGALLAIGQTDIKRLIAYTSISHFGFIALGVFAMTSQGQAGSTLYMINHGFSTAALFLIAGFLIARRGSRLISDFGGVQSVAPVLAGTFLVAGLSSLALPGLSTFVSEFLVLVGTYIRYPVPAVIGTTGIVLAALYILIMYQRTMTGPVAPGNDKLPDLRPREVWAVAPLLAVIIGLGVYPKPVLDVITPAVDKTLTSIQMEDPEPTVPVSSIEGTTK